MGSCFRDEGDRDDGNEEKGLDRCLHFSPSQEHWAAA